MFESLVPWRRNERDPFTALQREMNRTFESFLRGNGEEKAWPTAFEPKIEITENPEGYELTAELPGMTEKDVHCQVTGNVLSLRGEKKATREEKRKGWSYSERTYGSFERAFTLPPEIEVDKIHASFKSGVLHVNLPRNAKAMQAARQVPVKGE